MKINAFQSSSLKSKTTPMNTGGLGEEGSEQWLIIVEVVFEISFMAVRRVLKRGVEARNMSTLQL